jgi:hypothetical protein
MFMGPSFWHSFSVHFPIALWLTATGLFFLSFLRSMNFLRLPALLMGALGSVGAWFAFQSGENALHRLDLRGVDPHLLYQHKDQALTAVIFFTSGWALASIVHFARRRFAGGSEAPAWLRFCISACLVLGSIYLLLSGLKGVRSKEGRFWALYRQSLTEKAR